MASETLARASNCEMRWMRGSYPNRSIDRMHASTWRNRVGHGHARPSHQSDLDVSRPAMSEPLLPPPACPGAHPHLKIGSNFDSLPQPGQPPGAKHATMPRRIPLLAGLLISLVSSAPVSSTAGPENEYAFYHENVMGTSLELRVRADNRKAADAAEARALHEIDRLAVIFSGYDPSSELSLWQERRLASRQVSAELFEVLQSCDFWSERTAGAFDPRTDAH